MWPCRWLSRSGRRIRIQARSDLCNAQISEDRRPIFLQNVRASRKPEPYAVTAKCSARGLFFHGEVAIRQAFGEQWAKHPGPIRAFRSCVRTSDNQTADTIAHAAPGTAVQAHEVA